MKTVFLLLLLFTINYNSSAQTVIFQEKFDDMPSYSLSGWPYQFSGVVPWQCGLPYWVGPRMIPTGAAMAENSGTNKVACFAECEGIDHNDSNVFTYSPIINLSTVTGAWLKYDSYFAGYTFAGDTEKATVEISTDNGLSFTVLEHVAPSNPQGLFNTHYIDLSAYNHYSNIRIGFRYSDGGGYLMMGWAIDNVTVFIPAHKDISITSVTPNDTLLNYLIPGGAYYHHAKIYNNGLDTIHSFKLSYKQDAGPVKIDNITGLNLPPFSTTDFTHNIPDTVVSNGTHLVRIWATLDSDTYHNNDSGSATLKCVDFIPSKKLAIESGEGTYNGWSPRNIYYLSSVPGFDIAACLISVHEADPMVDTPYHDYMFNLGWNYVPYILFDRRKSIHLDNFYYYLNVQKKYFGFADIALTSSVSGNNLIVNATITPAISLQGDYRLALILTEDGVTGTTPAYDQVNNYALNALGPMGGFETMTNPIPASSMVYNYVARKADPTPDGIYGMLPSPLEPGNSYEYTFTTSTDPSWNINRLHAKVLLIRHADSTILNSNEVSFPLSINNNNVIFQNIEMYPNPATENTDIYFEIPTEETIHISLSDIAGRTLYQYPITDFKPGKNAVNIPVHNFSSGIYLVNISSPKGNKSLKLQVLH